MKLRYKQPNADTSQLLSHAIVDRGARIEQSSDDFRFAAAVAGFGMLLRGSDKGAATSRIRSWASSRARRWAATSTAIAGSC